MEKLLVALMSLVAAFAVGFSTPATASTGWCDHTNYDGVYRDYVGYGVGMQNEVPAGEGPSANVNIKSYTQGDPVLYGAGAAWVGVDAVNGNWVQAGLIVYSSSPTVVREYIEWNDANTGGREHFISDPLPTVPFNTPISVEMHRLASGSPTIWSVTIDGHSQLTTPIPGHWYTKQFTTENQNMPSSNFCGGLVARFSATSVQRTNMDPMVGLPDWLDTLGPTSWNSNSPYLSR